MDPTLLTIDTEVTKTITVEGIEIRVWIGYNQYTKKGSFQFAPINVGGNPYVDFYHFKNPLRVLKDVTNAILETPIQVARVTTGDDERRHDVFQWFCRHQKFSVKDYGRFFTITRNEHHDHPM